MMGKDKDHEVAKKYEGTITESGSGGRHDGKRKNHEVTGKLYGTGRESGRDRGT
jgi:hypothetical protein